MASRRSTRTARTSPASTTTTGRTSTSRPGQPRATTRRTASSTRWSSGLRTGRSACPRRTTGRSPSARFSSRPLAGSAPIGTRPTSRCSRSSPTTPCLGPPSGNRGGGVRSSTRSTWRCASGPGSWTSRPSRSSTSPGRAPAPPWSGCASARWTYHPGGRSTPRSSTEPAESSPTLRSCASRMIGSGW